MHFACILHSASRKRMTIMTLVMDIPTHCLMGQLTGLLTGPMTLWEVLWRILWRILRRVHWWVLRWVLWQVPKRGVYSALQYFDFCIFSPEWSQEELLCVSGYITVLNFYPYRYQLRIFSNGGHLENKIDQLESRLLHSRNAHLQTTVPNSCNCVVIFLDDCWA
jgi:hypothetical protein